ncbi:hypothetical protein GCM10009716_34980 [Streptomyces sodiiphilus]|uniref:Thiocillin family RiPP n=1 Tax=Streptomyces sodiiphilus TaxID=226217 RepID=A0ABN2PJM9_9ACTN
MAEAVAQEPLVDIHTGEESFDLVIGDLEQDIPQLPGPSMYTMPHPLSCAGAGYCC